MTSRCAARALAISLLLASCSGDGGGGGPTDPGGSPTLTLTAGATELFVGATTQLLATARQANGQAAAGVAVDFSTTIGLLSATSVATDSQGRASTTLRATSAGTAVVTARMAGAAAAQLTIQMGQGSAIAVLPGASTVPPDGQTPVVIRVARRDGSPTPTGTQINLTTTLGALSDNRPRTDPTGVARTTLRGDGRTGTATLRAELPGEGAGEATVQFGSGRRMVISADPRTIAPQGSSFLTALLTEASGASVGAGIAVRFSTTLGRLDATDVFTDGSGAASTILRPSGATGQATIRATVEGVEGNTVVIVDGGARIRLRANPTIIAPGGSTQISVLATDADDTPLPTGTRIDVTTTLGRLDALILTLDTTGAASTTLRGDGRRGTARVTATAAGFSGIGTVEVTIR
jgi:adhesin/invasin